MGLGSESASEAGEFAGRSDHPMAGHDDGQRVSPVRSADSAGGIRVSQLPGKLAVTPRFAEWNRQQRLPHIFLEWGAAHVERNRELFSLPRKVFAKLALGLK